MGPNLYRYLYTTYLTHRSVNLKQFDKCFAPFKSYQSLTRETKHWTDQTSEAHPGVAGQVLL